MNNNSMSELMQQSVLLSNMLKEIKQSPNSIFKGHTYHYAARLFYILGQIDSAIDFLQKASLCLPANHPFLTDIKHEIAAYELKLKTNVAEYLNSTKEIRLWIFSSQGIDFFRFNPFPKIDSIQLGGFFSAIRSLCHTLNQQKIESIDLESEKYYFYSDKSHDIFIAGLFPSFISISEIMGFLENLHTAFIAKFSREINHFDGNLNRFSNFDSEFLSIVKNHEQIKFLLS